MTSWTKRIQNCSYVINSILKNTVKPDTIFLNLSVEEFPNKWNDLPYELIDLSQKNPIVKINWVYGTNTKSMKKVFPILQYIEDDDIIIVNKPKNMVVHPAAGHTEGTLVNALLYHCGEKLSCINGVLRPGIVHRLDKDTSGVIIVAKNDKSHINLSEQIKNHEVEKTYIALVKGFVKENEATINMPIRKKYKRQKKNGSK